MKMKRETKFGEESTCCFKGIWQILTCILKSLKDFHCNGLLLRSYVLFEVKMYRGVMFHENEESRKISRKTDLLLGKWHDEFCKFPPEHSKVSKLELW